jgi:hypothetical protein
MSENKVEQLRDEGSRMQVVAAGAIAGLVSRYRHPTLPTLSACATLAFLSTPLYHVWSHSSCRNAACLGGGAVVYREIGHCLERCDHAFGMPSP